MGLRNNFCKSMLITCNIIRDTTPVCERNFMEQKYSLQKYIVLILLLCGVHLSGCASGKVTAPESSLHTTVVENPQLFRNLSLAATGTRERGVFNPLLGAASSLGFNAIEKIITNERGRTTLTHFDARSDLYFYDQLSDIHPLDPSGIRFDGLDIIRWKTDDLGRPDTAMFVSLELDTSNPSEILNNSIFRLKVAEMRVYDSEVPDSRRWYNPVSWFREKPNTLNVSMVVTFLASWIDDAMVMHSEVPMGRFVLSFDEIPLRGTPGHEEFLANVRGSSVQGYSYLIPRSTGFTYDENYNLTKKYGQGRFSIQIEVKESRVDKIQTTGIVKISE
jgi:hypothetical protein